jgi:large subunit ribosomal protein L29
MDANELRQLPEKELFAKIDEIRKRLFDLGFKAGTEDVTNPAEVREYRKDIARIQVILTERRLKGAPKRLRITRSVRMVKNVRSERAKAEARRKAEAGTPKPKAKQPAAKKTTATTTTATKAKATTSAKPAPVTEKKG